MLPLDFTSSGLLDFVAHHKLKAEAKVLSGGSLDSVLLSVAVQEAGGSLSNDDGCLQHGIAQTHLVLE